MLVQIPGVLNAEELTALQRTLEQSEFIDGKRTAGMAAERVKRNEELDRDAPQKDPLARILMGALYRSDTFRAAAMPAKVSTPIFARYAPGMTYGDHVDDPIMGSGEHYRSDVSFTVFLSEPDSYEGGELTIRTTFGEKRVKLRAGDAVVYPSSSLHHVAEVTAGQRLVGLGWIQSMVRDPARRELLFELGRAREELLREAGGSEATALVDRSYANLVRMWCDV